MDAFAQLPADERRIYFEQTAARMGVSPQIIEKDFWVCWTLKQLFALPDIGPHLIFKGGTSLSKAFKLIERFSEDIDVSIELGARSDHRPCEARPVSPYVAEEFPKAFQEVSSSVKVLAAERTFWEKARSFMRNSIVRPARRCQTGSHDTTAIFTN